MSSNYLVTLQRRPAYVSTLWETDGAGNKLRRVHQRAAWAADEALKLLDIGDTVPVVDFTLQSVDPDDSAMVQAICKAIEHMEAKRNAKI